MQDDERTVEKLLIGFIRALVVEQGSDVQPLVVPEKVVGE